MSSLPTPASLQDSRIAFVGGGNMASAIVGGLLATGLPAARISVLEPFEAARQALRARYGVLAQASAGDFLAQADVLVWAVKPQSFAEAAAPVRAQLAAAPQQALHLSVMAGIRCAHVAAAVGSARVVRAMPNTPALIGQGMTGLYADPAHVPPAERALADAILRATGQTLWVERESLLDAVTAVSGSGPAYVFYVLEAMQQAGQALGLSADQARHLAAATFAGSAQLATQSPEPLATLRERVTSKGGTTHAALSVLQDAQVQASFERALHACAQRAQELGDAFGA